MGNNSTIGYANSNDLYIRIQRVTNRDSHMAVEFRAALTEFTDSITANWNTEEVFGRMDPIATYQNTQRRISLGWEVIAFDYDEAYENMEKFSTLQKFLYPLFDGESATSMADAPLLRLSLVNLIQGASPGSTDSKYGSNKMLLGFVDGGFNFSPDLEAGFFHRADAREESTNTMLPKKFSLSCDYVVLHEEKLGWHLRNPEVDGKPEFGNRDSDGNMPTGRGLYEWRGKSTFPSMPYDKSVSDNASQGEGSISETDNTKKPASVTTKEEGDVLK